MAPSKKANDWPSIFAPSASPLHHESFAQDIDDTVHKYRTDRTSVNDLTSQSSHHLSPLTALTSHSPSHRVTPTVHRDENEYYVCIRHTP